MAKSKISTNDTLLIFVGIIWFLLISFITAQTEYQKLIVSGLGLPSSTGDILNILIIIITLIPSGFLFAYTYANKNFNKVNLVSTIGLSFVIACVLFVPFSWYNFSVNFAR